MTNKQKQALKKINQVACSRYAYSGIKPVFTRYDIKDMKYFVAVSFEIRQLNRDAEGNKLFSIHSPRDHFTRESAHFFIGKNGGITIAGISKRSRKQKYPLIHGFTNR